MIAVSGFVCDVCRVEKLVFSPPMSTMPAVAEAEGRGWRIGFGNYAQDVCPTCRQVHTAVSGEADVPVVIESPTQ